MCFLAARSSAEAAFWRFAGEGLRCMVLTAVLKEFRNRLLILVLRWSARSFLTADLVIGIFQVKSYKLLARNALSIADVGGKVKNQQYSCGYCSIS